MSVANALPWGLCLALIWMIKSGDSWSIEEQLALVEARLESLENPNWITLEPGTRGRHWGECSTICNCSWEHQSIDCRQKFAGGWKNVWDQVIITDVHHLDLSENKLSGLSTEAFRKLRDLEELNLGKNSLTYISRYAFVDLGRLLHLKMAFNNLATLPNLLLAPCTKLQNIDLSQNKLGTLSGDFLAKNQELKQIDLSWNSLSRLGHLELGSSVMLLDLSHNSLLSIAGISTESIQFTDLLLKDNLLSDVGFLSELEGLKRVDLSGNRIKTLVPGILDRLSHLGHLNLQLNELATFDPASVPRNISSLNLSKNMIETVLVPLEPFHVAELDLSDNLMAERLNLDEFPDVVKIKILGNLFDED